MRTEFNLKTSSQGMMQQLIEWAKSLSPEEKAKVRGLLVGLAIFLVLVAIVWISDS